MIIVGVDPGTRSTGFGVLRAQGARIRCEEYGIIRTDAKKDMSRRLHEIYLSLQSILVTWEPDLVAVEKAFMGKNVQSALKLGQARGVILLAAQESGARIAEFAPTAVKKSVVGSGRAEKGQVEFMVRRLLGLSDRKIRDDAFDALGIALCACNHGLNR
ncbi:MAG: crossover junction endodeoxyribonuclease RuvC [Fibrobacterota bacterium]